uniref:Cathepsin E n=1 Tax=Aceria tosichella TaxID=561515 RepID=A0A6G1SM20_9ACAR
MAARIIILLLVFGALADFPGLLQASKTVKIALSKRTSMQAGNLGQPVTSYYTSMDFGTPPISFNMLIDVNAREVWLPHHLKLGMVYQRLNYRNGYRKTGSTTSLKEPDSKYRIEYKGCDLTGKAYRDVIRFRDVTGTILPVKFEQRFIAVSSASSDIFNRFTPADGVLAFSPWPTSESGSDTICLAMKRANLTGELRFGLELNQEFESQSGGVLTIGDADMSKIEGDFRFHHLVTINGNWEIGLQQVMFGAHTIDVCQHQVSNRAPCSALISTTSDDIYGPSEAIKTMLRFLGFTDVDTHAPLYEIDCLKVATAPTLTFVIDGINYTLPPTSYIKKKVDGFYFKSTTCYVALLPNLSDNKWELGTSFLSQYYSVFDIERRVVAFGKRKSN